MNWCFVNCALRENMVFIYLAKLPRNAVTSGMTSGKFSLVWKLSPVVILLATIPQKDCFTITFTLFVDINSTASCYKDEHTYGKYTMQSSSLTELWNLHNKQYYYPNLNHTVWFLRKRPVEVDSCCRYCIVWMWNDSPVIEHTHYSLQRLHRQVLELRIRATMLCQSDMTSIGK